MSIPENLILLHTGEEECRKKSIQSITADKDLSDHLQMIEHAMDIINIFIMQHVHTSKDELTIQCLGIRLFNDLSSSIKLLFSGYYQTATVMLRDVLETVFLLDYLKSNTELITTWAACSEEERLKSFSPVKIRIALDDRDGLTTRKREEAYKLLCRLAAHPSPEGFRMLTPIAGGDAHCGPFFEFTALKAVLSEMAKLAIQAGNQFALFFPKNTNATRGISLDFMEKQGKWCERFYNRPYDPKPIDDIRADMRKLEDQPSG